MMHFLALALLLTCSPTALLDFAIPKWKADKAVRIEDAYKWLYQATRGGEHAAPSRDMAKGWMDREWSLMGEDPKGEKAWEPLCRGSEIGRLNLRAFRTSGGTANEVLDAFLASAADYRSEPAAFTDVWALLGKRLKKQGFNSLNYAEWQRLDAAMKAKNYPAVHHSEPYKAARHPAYRIITKSEWSKLKRR